MLTTAGVDLDIRHTFSYSRSAGTNDTDGCTGVADSAPLSPMMAPLHDYYPELASTDILEARGFGPMECVCAHSNCSRNRYDARSAKPKRYYNAYVNPKSYSMPALQISRAITQEFITMRYG